MYKYYKSEIGIKNNKNYHIYFVEITDLLEPVDRIMSEILDYTWLNKFSTFKQAGLKENMLRTIPDLITDLDIFFLNSTNGETLVSYIGKHSMVDILKHDGSIPLGEIYKPAKKQNGGFDFFTQSPNDLLFFGEAKFLSKGNSYNSALRQMNEFYDDKKDLSDSNEIAELLRKNVKVNLLNSNKGYCAAFTLEQKNSPKLFKTITSNLHFNDLTNKNITEVVCVGVFFNV